jgi:hypothetical protein
MNLSFKRQREDFFTEKQLSLASKAHFPYIPAVPRSIPAIAISYHFLIEV